MNSLCCVAHEIHIPYVFVSKQRKRHLNNKRHISDLPFLSR